MKKLIQFPIIASLLLLIFSYGFIIRNYVIVPEDRYYYGSPYTTPLDFLGSLAIARKGFLGMWQGYLSLWQIHPDRIQESVIDLVKQEYVIMGHISRLFTVDPLYTLLFSRLLLTIVLLYVMYVFIKTMTTTKEELHLGFFLVLFAVGVTWPWEGWSNSAVIAGVGDSIYPAFRYTFVAHHYLIGQILTLVSMMKLAAFLKTGKHVHFFISVACGLCTTVVFLPSSLLLVASSWVPFFAAIFQKDKGNLRNIIRRLLWYIVYCFIILLPVPLIYLNVKTFVDTEWLIKLRWNLFHYAYSVGIIYVFSLFALLRKQKSQPYLFYWAFSWVILHPLVGFVIQYAGFYSIKRAFQIPYMPIFAALSAIGIIRIKELSTKIHYVIGTCIIPTVVVLVVISGYKTYNYTMPIENFQDTPESVLGYPSKNNMEAIWWLRDNTIESDIVVASYNNGILIPAFSGNRTFINPWFRMINIIHYYPQELQMFYNGSMNPSDVINFYKSHHIAYVFYGQDERALLAPKRTFPYPELIPVFSNETVTIYEVPKEWRN